MYDPAAVATYVITGGPVPAPATGSTVVQVYGSGVWTSFLTSDGTLMFRGNNASGVAGDGTVVAVTGLSKPVASSVREIVGPDSYNSTNAHSYIATNGAWFVTGRNNSYKLMLSAAPATGVNTWTSAPLPYPNIQIVQAYMGDNNVVFLDSFGAIYISGLGNSGQRGIGYSPISNQLNNQIWTKAPLAGPCVGFRCSFQNAIDLGVVALTTNGLLSVWGSSGLDFYANFVDIVSPMQLPVYGTDNGIDLLPIS